MENTQIMKRGILLAAVTMFTVFCSKSNIEEQPSPPSPPAEPEEEERIEDIVKSGLPVIYLSTDKAQAITSKENYVKAELKIAGTDKFEDLPAVTCNVRGRGNTTWSWPKKPYTIKLDKKESLLGMPKHKRWVLLANFMDKTMMRNIVAMKLGSMSSLDWTPRCVPVELVLNGKHKGNYLLIEQIKADVNRVPVDEDNGYILELDYHDDNEIQWVDPHGHSYDAYCAARAGIPFGIKNPDPEVISTEQINWIKERIFNIASKIYGEDNSKPGNTIGEDLDYKSFADYFIIFELLTNGELSNPGSIYFHTEKEGKVLAGPLWDFDWGILSYNAHPNARTSLINTDGVWFEKLLDNPEFKAALKQRWAEFLPSILTIPDYIEDMRTLLAKSAEKNFKMWDPSEDKNFNNGNIINGDEKMSYDAAVSRLKTIYNERVTTVGNKIEAL